MSDKGVMLEALVIRPTLAALGVTSRYACQLLLGTALSETGLRPRRGARLGLYGITPAQHRQVWDCFLAFQPALASRVRSLASRESFLRDPDQELVTNPAYATAIAWLVYQSGTAELPAAPDSRELVTLWARYFHRGKAVPWRTPALSS